MLKELYILAKQLCLQIFFHQHIYNSISNQMTYRGVEWSGRKLIKLDELELSVWTLTAHIDGKTQYMVCHNPLNILICYVMYGDLYM